MIENKAEFIETIKQALKLKAGISGIRHVSLSPEIRKPYSLIQPLTVTTETDSISLIVKIPLSGNLLNKMIGEFDGYQKLENVLKGSEFSTLRTIGYLKSPPSLISYRVEGFELSKLIRKTSSSGNFPFLKELMRNCGRMLATIHNKYKPGKETLSLDYFNELEHYLNKLDKDSRILNFLNDELKRIKYNDYTPWNILVTNNGNLVVLDPPHTELLDFIHNDLARFRLGLVRTLYHPSWIIKNHTMPLEEFYEAFLAGYQETFGYSLTADDRVLIDAYELLLWDIVFGYSRKRIFSRPREIYIILTGLLRRFILRSSKTKNLKSQ